MSSAAAPSRPAAAPDNARDLLAPLVIGVTGHRDLIPGQIAKLKEQVRDIFEKRIISQYPATPLILISGLAAGADRLVAAVGLKLGVRLIATLPLPQEEYERDFSTEEEIENDAARLHLEGLAEEDRELFSLEGFHFFLKHAYKVTPLGLAEGNTDESIRAHGPARDRQYQALGLHLADRCQLLIALWDGFDTGLVGGTASVVCYQATGVPKMAGKLDPPDCFPIYHLQTPRSSNPHIPDSFKVSTLYPADYQRLSARGHRELNQAEYSKLRGEQEEFYRRMFSRLDAFNREARNTSAEALASMETSKGYVMPATPAADGRPYVSPASLPVAMQTLLDRYAVADVLAQKYQKQTKSGQRRIHFLVFTAFALFVLYGHLVEIEPLGQYNFRHNSLVIVAAGLVVGLAEYLRRTTADHNDNYQDYRALAEGLRTRFFWLMAGIRESVADRYLGKQRTELDWIRNGFRGWEIEGPAGSTEWPAEISLLDRIRVAGHNWVEDQRDFYRKHAPQEENAAEKLEMISQLSLGLVGLCALLMIGLSWWLHESVNYLIIMIDLALAAGALVHHYNNRMAYSEHAKQYSRMTPILEQAAAQLRDAILGKDKTTAKLILRSAGEELLRENGDWVLTHRERPLELPHP